MKITREGKPLLLLSTTVQICVNHSTDSCRNSGAEPSTVCLEISQFSWDIWWLHSEYELKLWKVYIQDEDRSLWQDANLIYLTHHQTVSVLQVHIQCRFSCISSYRGGKSSSNSRWERPGVVKVRSELISANSLRIQWDCNCS